MRLQKTKAYILIIILLLFTLTLWKSMELEITVGNNYISNVNGSLASQDSYHDRTTETLNTDDKDTAAVVSDDDQNNAIENDDEEEEDHDEEEDDDEDDMALFFRYKPPPTADVEALGKTFKVPQNIAQETADLSNHIIELNAETAPRFAVAMASSENHFNETLDGLASAQFHFPGKKILYYDIGLSLEQIAEVKTWRDVIYRKFDFSKYPKHFEENLRMCVWKPFIIRDVLKEFGGVLWMDASVRMHSGDFTAVYDAAIQNGGLVLFKSTGHSNFAATHKSTYDYIPTRRKKQKEIYMKCAAGMMIYNTREMFYNVLWWWFLCAYEEKCQAPMPKTMCEFDEERRMEVFADCHKWDQSTINILLSNYHGYDMKKYTVPEEIGVITVERWPTNYYTMQTI